MLAVTVVVLEGEEHEEGMEIPSQSYDGVTTGGNPYPGKTARGSREGRCQ